MGVLSHFLLLHASVKFDFSQWLVCITFAVIFLKEVKILLVKLCLSSMVWASSSHPFLFLNSRLRRTTNRILASSCCSSNVLGSVNVCGFEPDQVKVRVKDGKVCVSAERENRYDCLGSKKYSYMNICKEFSLPPCVDEKDVTYSYGLGSCVKIESPCYPCTSPCNPCDPCSPCDPCNPCYPCGSRFSCRKMIL